MTSTIELARRQGVLRSRSIDGLVRSSPSSSTIGPFRYYLVIDFEATCWSSRPSPPSEIIEFPAVLLDSQTFSVLPDPFHEYVQPIEEPHLSPFCRELTGITQQQVEASPPLGSVLLSFSSWLRRQIAKYNLSFAAESRPGAENLCAVVTWTDWDLNICLDKECSRKQLRKPSCLEAWVDIKCIYSKFYGRKPQGLNGALQQLGLAFEGRQHSGLCDATNTAKLVAKMIRDGCTVGITKTRPGVTVDKSLMYIAAESPGNMVVAKIGTVVVTPKNNTSRPLQDVTNVARKTPPLCSCGRRAKCLQVSKPGPNQGRQFFSCTKRTSSTTTSGCGFFKWADSVVDQGQSPVFRNTTKTTVIKDLPPSYDSSPLLCKTLGNSSKALLSTTPSTTKQQRQYFGNVNLQV